MPFDHPNDLVFDVRARDDDGVVHFVHATVLEPGQWKARCGDRMPASDARRGPEPPDPVDCLACLSLPLTTVEEAWRMHLDWCDQCNYDKPCVACEADYADPRSHACNCEEKRQIGYRLRMAAGR